jgi:hypothetical protein
MPKYRVRGKIATVSDVDYCDIETATPEEAIEIAWNGWKILDESADHDEPIHREDWGADLLGEDGMTDFERGDSCVKIIVPDGEFVLKDKAGYRHLLQENGSERELTPDQAEGLCAAGYIHRCEEHSTPTQHVYHTHATQTWEEIEEVIEKLAVSDEPLPSGNRISITVLESHEAIVQIDRNEIEVSENDAERDLFLLEAPIKGEDDDGGSLHIFDRDSLQQLSFDAPDCPGKPRLSTQKWIKQLLAENLKATIFWFHD